MSSHIACCCSPCPVQLAGSCLGRGYNRPFFCQSLASNKAPRIPGLCKIDNTNGALPGTTKVSDGLSSRNSSFDVDFCKSKLKSLFRSEGIVAEEERPKKVTSTACSIGNKPRCFQCEAKGLVLCATCAGSGLYVDSILESQGIIVKVRCLGCGGSGSIICSECGGRGHL